MNPTYQVGDVIAYQPFGMIAERIVRVTAKEADIKNGRPGFDGTLVLGAGSAVPMSQRLVWGYDDQITRIVERQPAFANAPELARILDENEGRSYPFYCSGCGEYDTHDRDWFHRDCWAI